MLRQKRRSKTIDNVSQIKGGTILKIQGPGHPSFNPYQKQQQKEVIIKNAAPQQDQLQISGQAKNMQKNEGLDPARQERVNQIKQQVEAGTYEIDAKQTAQKMLDFWNNSNG